MPSLKEYILAKHAAFGAFKGLPKFTDSIPGAVKPIKAKMPPPIPPVKAPKIVKPKVYSYNNNRFSNTIQS